MDRATAEKLMEIYDRVGTTLCEAESVIVAEPDHDARKKLLLALGEQMGNLWVSLQAPIVKEYPDLDPDRDLPKRGVV
jgi:hypothetical protein